MAAHTSDSPLFDESSLYNRLRSQVDPEEKLKGYFLWQQMKWESGKPRERLAARSHPVGGPTEARPAIGVRLDRPDENVAAEVTLEPAARIKTFKFQIAVHLEGGGPPEGTPFRVILISQTRIRLLRDRLQDEGGPVRLDLDDRRAIRQLFREDAMRNLEVARQLASAPELSGRFRGSSGRVGIQWDLPEERPNIPNDVNWVIAFDPMGVGELT